MKTRKRSQGKGFKKTPPPIPQMVPMTEAKKLIKHLYAVGEEGLVRLIDDKNTELMKSYREKYVDWLKKYFYIGGMPEVVSSFVDNKDFEIAIEWLQDCGLIKKVYNISKPAMPLKAYIEFSAFKLYLLDVGLLGALSDLDAMSILDGNAIFVEFKGALTEQYVHQQLIADTEYTPYYFTETKSEGEIDFVIQKGKNIIPIEVKAEENLRAKSLRVYCDKYMPEIAIRTSMSDYREQDWMTNVPLWMISTI